MLSDRHILCRSRRADVRAERTEVDGHARRHEVVASFVESPSSGLTAARRETGHRDRSSERIWRAGMIGSGQKTLVTGL